MCLSTGKERFDPVFFDASGEMRLAFLAGLFIIKEQTHLYGVVEKQDELKRSFKHPSSLFIPKISNATFITGNLIAA